MAILSPPILRMEWTVCQRCGRESSMCAKVAIRIGGWQSKRFDRAVMTCAQCREAHRGNWLVDSRWQGVDCHPEPKYDGVAWEAWKAANPPLRDDELMEDDE